MERLSQIPRHNRFASDPYPECWIVRSTLKHIAGVAVGDMHTA
jgi:hypothetical protein